ncbi:adenylate/guanylate cyclase domain-containing protein [Ruegeria sp. HKCCD4884]|uniref:adenylate/guanylate cyclase domain-containing protein n=1 Tax=Ruegeria sp. HKCCD4884 TaxID=2683022 RepID=UPI001490FC0C|nr:adenylate/guanylate cyclase domain-containing protein [Ruegeria sp. HKCCD4884]NOD95094.1 adenylate/guanylate cyclase domain-containing protein [Ruegeria sp. HKCCD4884]
MAAPLVQNWELTAAVKDIADWLVQQGLENAPVELWLEAFCNRLVSAGIPLQRANITVRAHHPEIGTVAFRWHRDGGNERENFVRRTDAPEEYVLSPIYYLLANNVEEIRQDLTVEEPALNFPIFDELRERGATDYFAVKRFFLIQDNTTPVDPMQAEEGAIISLTTDASGGFTSEQLDGLRQLISPLCLTLKCGANRLMAEDITAAYLGKDASRRVLSGDITRGSSETISAVIWYFDLQGFTRLSEALPGDSIIELLNDYFAEAVDVVERNGGNVLKFMGDGMLAIFDINQVPDARRVAIHAAAELRNTFEELNQRRQADGLPTTGFTLSLHAGDVLYGNIGGRSRLDFTVVGPAVNTTSRILGMCSALDQNIVVSDKVAGDLVGSIPSLVSLGQYRLRGVAERQELFTID